MPRLINADELIKQYAHPNELVYTFDIANRINDAPTIYGVEVVRCKDCKWWWERHKICAHDKHSYDNVCFQECEENDYCSDGEMR